MMIMKKTSFSILSTLMTAALLTGCAGQPAAAPVDAPQEEEKVAVPAAKDAAAEGQTYRGPAFDVDAVIRGMDATDFECGEAPDVGIWVVAKVSIPDDEKVPVQELLFRSALLAKQSISEWMNS